MLISCIKLDHALYSINYGRLINRSVRTDTCILCRTKKSKVIIAKWGRKVGKKLNLKGCQICRQDSFKKNQFLAKIKKKRA